MSFLEPHAITNDYRHFRLVRLRTWKGAAQFEPRDQAGPYLVSQIGYDPADGTMTPEEFLLGQTGEWLSVGRFFRLTSAIRRRQFIHATVAEMMDVLRSLPAQATVMRIRGDQLGAPASDAECEELKSVFGETPREVLPVDPRTQPPAEPNRGSGRF
jgi:hypothetical protein